MPYCNQVYTQDFYNGYYCEESEQFHHLKYEEYSYGYYCLFKVMEDLKSIT